MKREHFEALVGRAVDSLPPEFRSELENVDVIVEDWPSSGQLRRVKVRNPGWLLGLYEGVPQVRRGRGYGMVLPDKVSIFQKPIEAQCHSDGEIEMRIAEVVQHEIAHHFGSDEKALREMEEKKYRKNRH
ncbi:MAG: metallopeptidase family protein [Dehalococcoidia bacterium]|nr:metallopeptidase family protein [Dehalococcoidia bacterium]